GIVEPFQRGGVGLFLFPGWLLADAVGAIIAGLVAIPGQRREIHEHDVAGLDDAVGKIAPVRPGIGARGDDYILDILHARDAVEIFHQMRGYLVLGDAGAQEFHALPVRGIADRADDTHAFLLVLVLDRARLHHRRHAVDPLDLLVLEDVDHVDIDEIDAELLPGDAVSFHLVNDGFGEFLHLLLGGRPGGTLDPGIGVADVLLGYPWRVAFDLKTEIALLEKDRLAVTA